MDSAVIRSSRLLLTAVTLFGLASASRPSPADAAADEIRTCVIGNADELRDYLSSTGAHAASDLVSDAKALTAAGGGDCGITAVSGTCDLIFVSEGPDQVAAIVGIGAPDGPMPQTNAALELLAASNIKPRSIVLHHVDQVQDQELLSLITSEISELLTQKGIAAPDVPVCRCGPDCGPKAPS